jgi:hypothetical protein
MPTTNWEAVAVTDKEKSEQYIYQPMDFVRMGWVYATHNTKTQQYTSKSVRKVCICQDCEMFRRIVNDDLHVEEHVRPVRLRIANGETLEEFLKESEATLRQLYKE